MSERGRVFGTAAEAYDRHRLGYPDEVADLVLRYARSPLARALEVGAGTGKATVLLARRGLAVTACEPDPAMAGVLRRRTAGLDVEVVVRTFEQLPADEAYDLLWSASAWHWTDPATRWDRTAALVRPGGTVALFGSTGTELADPDLEERVAVVRREAVPDEERVVFARGASGRWWPGTELDADARFGDVEEHEVVRRVRRTREEHLGLLGTLSTYLRLPVDVRSGLLTQIGAVLPDEVEADALVRLHLARRL